MARNRKAAEHVNHERWLVSYADFITLLFATFTALYAISNADLAKFAAMADSLKRAFSDGPGSVSAIDIPRVISRGGSNPNSALVISIFPESATAPPPRPNKGAAESNDNDLLDGSSPFQHQGAGEDGGETEAAGTPRPTPPPQAQSPMPEDPALPSKPEGMGNEALAVEIQDLIHAAGLEGKVDLRSENRGMVISLGEAAFFAPGEIDVLPQCRHQLDKIVNLLRNKHFEIRVEGHTDTTPIKSGRYRSNLELSTLRAASIVNFMIREYGFDGHNLSGAGYGEFRPIANNSTEDGRQKNRRVDIVILNQEAARNEPH